MQKELHVCGIIIENNKILLLQRSLNDESEPGKWCPINETVEVNEPLEKAIVRGVREEVGIKFSIVKQIKPQYFNDKTTTVFIGTRSGKINIDKNESNQYGWFTYDEAIQLDFAYNYENLLDDLNHQSLLTSNKSELLEYLRSQKLMSFAVSNENDSWISTAYYYIDDSFNLYIYTSPQTKHGRIIDKTTKVLCNIYDSHQKITDDKIGVQIRGKINQVKSLKALKYAFTMWNKVNPGVEGSINYKNLVNKVISGRIYKITPQIIQFFNEALYPEDEYEIFHFKN